MDFKTKLAAAWEKNNSLLCVGLDPDLEKFAKHLKPSVESIFDFNKAIIDATAEFVCAFKPNSAFYESHGAEGIEQLKKTCDYLRQTYPHIPILLDSKRGDIGNTNEHYATFAFDYLGADAVTIAPYMGREANQAFLDRKDKGIIVLCRTSNPGAGEFQDLDVGGQKLYQLVAEHVIQQWNQNGNCLLVVGATSSPELVDVRSLIGDDVTLLIPGIGLQGGDVEATVRGGINIKGTGAIINSSRGIIFASAGEDFAQAAEAEAKKVRDEINKYR